MSWSVTVDNLQEMKDLPDSIYLSISKDNPQYEHDANLAFIAAHDAGLVSATLAGGRTPSPYGGPDVVTISILGFDSYREGHAVEKTVQGSGFIEQVRQNIYAGPDETE